MWPDSELVIKLKKQDRSAFQSIYQKYADKVFNVSKSFHLEHEEAEEIVQEVFLTLWEKKHLLNENLSLNAFLLTITKNKIINYQKKKINELKRNRTFIEHNSPSTSTEDEVIFHDLQKFALQFIDSLPNRKKEIFLLSRRDGLSNEEIAELLQISQRTVENNIYQAEKLIRYFFQENHLTIKSLAGMAGIFLY